MDGRMDRRFDEHVKHFRAMSCIIPTSSSAGIFFVLPCIESYQRVDLRTITLGVPPQEVGKSIIYIVRHVNMMLLILGAYL